MPRLIKEAECPHCGATLPELKPRSCPDCGGSLQQRYLGIGCLSSGPGLLLVSWLLWRFLEA